jgi:lauroyl/myristoyl acyltransferase
VRRRVTAFVKKVFPLRTRAALFQSLVPRQFWFSGVLALSRFVAKMARITGCRGCARYEASSVDGWLAELTHRGPFPIKYKVNGAHNLARTAADQAGILYCGVHLPLTAVMMRALLELGAPPDFLLAAPHNVNQDGQWVPAGVADGFKAISPGPNAVRQVRTVLSEGGRFASMMDQDVGAPLRRTLMRLAGSVGARVILCWVVMDTKHNIVVNIRAAPHPIPDTEEKVSANLAVLEDLRQRVLANLRGQSWGIDE